MNFTEFVIKNHPDPDSVLVDCKIDELDKLAKAFSDEQSKAFGKKGIKGTKIHRILSCKVYR
jgi:hypothetical protein